MNRSRASKLPICIDNAEKNEVAKITPSGRLVKPMNKNAVTASYW